MNQPDPFPTDTPTDPPPSAIFGRLFWFAIGPAALVVLAILIMNGGNGWLTVVDILFFLAIGLMVLSRWAEIRSGHGRTAYNEPATPAHFRRYVAVMVPIALVAWTVANVVGNHLIAG